MPDDDVLEEGGLEPAAEAAEADAPEVDEVEEVEEPSYRWSEIAEALPHLDRFAKDHEGLDAVRQYGKSYDSARGLISQGGHLSRQEEDAYRAAGIDPSEVQVPQEEYQDPGLFGVPWGEPTTWDEVNLLAQSEVAEHKERAAHAVLRDANAPEDYKQAYWDNAYGQGSYRALTIQQTALREDFERREKELEERILERMAPVQQAHTNTYVDGLLGQARSGIPGFKDHEATIRDLMTEREQRYPGYTNSFNQADSATQLNEFRELTIIAAARTAPARASAAAATADATDAEKVRTRTETSRTNGATDPSGDLKRQSLDEAKRVFGQVR